MPKTALVVAQPSPRLAPLVRQHADALRPKWQSVVASAREFIPALLEFAVAYRDAYTEVKDNLGNEAVKALNAGIGLTDTAASRLRDIAEAHNTALPSRCAATRQRGRHPLCGGPGNGRAEAVSSAT